MKDERQSQMLDDSIREALAGDGFAAPWSAFPDQPRFSSFWFAGGGQWPLPVLARWLERQTVAERVAFFAEHVPVPAEWADWVASVVYDEWELDSDDAIVEQVHRLAREHGLVDPIAWEAWLDEGG